MPKGWRKIISDVKEVFEGDFFIRVPYDDTGLIPFYNDFLCFKKIRKGCNNFIRSTEHKKNMSSGIKLFWESMDLREKIKFCKMRRDRKEELYRGRVNWKYNYDYNSTKGINPFIGCKKPDPSKRRTPINHILIDFRKHSRKVNYAGVMNNRDFDSIW